MLTKKLILRLFKSLCQVLAALITRSAQRLRMLVTCFRHFVAKLKIRGFPRHTGNNDSTTLSPVDCCTVPPSTSGVRYPPVKLPLPLHNRQITSASAARSGTQDMLLSSMPVFPMPEPCIPQQFIPPQPVLPPQVPNTNPSSVPNTNIELVPFAANDISRYENRPFVYVNAIYLNNVSILRRRPLETQLKGAMEFKRSRDSFQTSECTVRG